MGLDSAEIVMEVENSFGIRIPDREAEKILTVGDFHNLVWEYVKDRKSIKCKSQSLFYKLRKSLTDTVQIPKEKINPATTLTDIIPKDNRRKLWFQLSSDNQLEFPGLVLTSRYSIILTTIGFISILGGLSTSLILINFFDITKWSLIIPLAGIVLTILISKLLNSQRTEFEQNDLREFTNKVLKLNYATLSLDGGLNRKEVEMIITNIIADKAGLELDEVTPEKKIHHDLGID